MKVNPKTLRVAYFVPVITYYVIVLFPLKSDTVPVDTFKLNKYETNYDSSLKEIIL